MKDRNCWELLKSEMESSVLGRKVLAIMNTPHGAASCSSALVPIPVLALEASVAKKVITEALRLPTDICDGDLEAAFLKVSKPVYGASRERA